MDARSLQAGQRRVPRRAAELVDVERLPVEPDLELVRDPADAEGPIGGSPAYDALPTSEAIDELLTSREREVLQLMVKGCSNGVIAERLVIREGTVKSHVKHILRKVGAVNRAEAISRYLGMVRHD